MNDTILHKILKCNIISQYLTRDYDEYAQYINPILGEFLLINESSKYQTLITSSALQSAIFAPGSNASNILRTIKLNGTEELYALIKLIYEFSDNCRNIKDVSVYDYLIQSNEEYELEKLISDLKEWKNNSRNLKIPVPPAKRVWAKWNEKSGMIDKLVDIILNNKTNEIEKFKIKIKELSDQHSLNKIIDDTYRIDLKHKQGSSINADGISAIIKHLKEFFEYANIWLNINNKSLSKSHNYFQELTSDFRKNFISLSNNSIKEIELLLQNSQSLEIHSGLYQLLISLKHLREIILGSNNSSNLQMGVDKILNKPLLFINSIVLDFSWKIKHFEKADLINDYFNYLIEEKNDYNLLFEEKKNKRDHYSTGHIIEILSENQNNTSLVEKYINEREKNKKECIDALQRDINHTSEILENEVSNGIINEKDRLDFKAKIDSIEQSLNEIYDFGFRHNILAGIKKDINSKKEKEINRLKDRLDKIGLDDNSKLQRINEALKNGDLLSANEYIHLVENQQELPLEIDSSDSFSKFFPDNVRELDQYLNKTKPYKVLIDIRERHLHIMKNVPGTQANLAADAIENWFEMKRDRKVSEHGVESIMKYFGFTTIRELNIRKQFGFTIINISTEELKDKNSCPISYYGSLAKGNYQIIPLWDRQSEDEIVKVYNQFSKNSTTFIFYFGTLTEYKRREIAHILKERRHKFLIIDDIILTYLAGERSARMKALFECTVPFSFYEPYTITAGLVPTEMFYGRTREIQQIFDPFGSCFIYGGRQLGKTALLREVEKRYNNPDDGIVIKWIDLKNEGIGYNKSIEEIFYLIAKELKQIVTSSPIIPDNAKINVSYEKIFEYIEQWIEKNKKNRIVLLLDEADNFLDLDGQDNFIKSQALKGLMEKTNRKFKIVFAGLHNVQRTSKQINQPLAHLGDAICVGPLLQNSEWKEARNLIEKPLKYCGYKFESPDLITRILSQTNYYPSLIQLYCNQLLKHLNDIVLNQNTRNTPPYIITSKQIDEVSHGKELRDAILKNFRLTLNLDPRYDFLTFAIAYDSLDDKELRLTEGFSIQAIREFINLWPEGFSNNSDIESIHALLDEMVGLGILRIVGLSNYALRSPNSLSLLGNDQQIEAELFKEREKPLEYAPDTFRSSYKSKGMEYYRKSPLTAKQEYYLKSQSNGISIIYGSTASGIKSVKNFLQSSFGEQNFYSIKTVKDKSDFLQKINDIIEKRLTEGKDSINLLLIEKSILWSPSWIDDVYQKIKKLHSKNSFIRIIFLADPLHTWDIISEYDKIESKNELNQISLKPWNDAAIRRWSTDYNFGLEIEERNKIFDKSGNWHLFIEKIQENLLTKIPLEEIISSGSSILFDENNKDSILKEFGLENDFKLDIIRSLSILGNEDISIIHEDLDSSCIENVIKWADKLNLIDANKELDPFLKRFIN